MAGDLFARARGAVLDALEACYPGIAEPVRARIEVVPARMPEHGDMATNAALVAAKSAGHKPAELAAKLATALAASELFLSATPAGPGFINLRLRPEVLHRELTAILRAGERYGERPAGSEAKVNVEYVSANPTGPLHVGHCRGAVVGDALANLLEKAGYAVTKEYYVNDAGAQVEALAWAAYWRTLEALGEPIPADEFSALAPGGLQYRGDYLVPVGRALAAKYGTALARPDPRQPSKETIALVRAFTVDAMLTAIRADLAALGVVPDVFTSERALYDRGAADRAIALLREKDLIYEGTLAAPKGKLPDDWEPRQQTLFRAERFGDETDRPLRKSDGSNTYFANDIAYHADKIQRGADVLIDVLGADHGGYVRRLRAAVTAVSDGRVPLEVVLCQIVHVMRGGVPVRMSKRAGNFVTLRELLDEVGRDAVRFTMLTRKADAQMDFDLDRVVAETRENPVFYVQYAHARCRSVLRAAAAAMGAEASDRALAAVPLDALAAEAELAVMRRLIGFPHLVAAAARAREPHRIAFFLYDLASDFHILWNRGREDPHFRFLQADHPVETHARLALVAATAVVLRAGLGILGVTPVEEMR